MSLSLVLRQEQSCEYCFGTVLPVTTKYVERLGTKDRERIFRTLVGESWARVADKYRSYTDFALCEVFVNFRPDCFRFYVGTGRALKYLYEARELKQLDYSLRSVLARIRRRVLVSPFVGR